MAVNKETLEMKVVDKKEVEKGRIFLKKEYIVYFKITDEKAKTHPVVERETSYRQFCKMEIGKTYDVTAYTPNGRNWYFSREEAELADEMKIHE